MSENSVSFDKDFALLEVAVKAAEDEAILALMFHETWKPTAYDTELHSRMGNSFATHSFQIIRDSLRREMLLALMRLWDTTRDPDKRPIRMTAISAKLLNNGFFEQLVSLRASRISNHPNTRQLMKENLKPKRDEIVRIVRKYSESGEGYSTIDKLRSLRNQRLAHRQTAPIEPDSADITDADVDSFYQDNLKLVELLLSVVLATSFNLEEAAAVYRHHAKYFWANARGERTEGHPNYRHVEAKSD